MVMLMDESTQQASHQGHEESSPNPLIAYIGQDQADFAPDVIAEGEYYFEPYNRDLAPYVQNQPSFWLPQQADQAVFATETLFVLPCAEIEAAG